MWKAYTRGYRSILDDGGRVMNLHQKLKNKLDWLKSTRGIQTADAKLTSGELELLVELLDRWIKGEQS